LQHGAIITYQTPVFTGFHAISRHFTHFFEGGGVPAPAKGQTGVFRFLKVVCLGQLKAWMPRFFRGESVGIARPEGPCPHKHAVDSHRSNWQHLRLDSPKFISRASQYVHLQNAVMLPIGCDCACGARAVNDIDLLCFMISNWLPE
jgi:hypothetical protein